MQLKIELESSSLTGDSGDANSLITNKRTISTNVLIEDGGIVVLGGLIQDSDIRGEQRVPYLGRIPVLGALFKTRSRQTDKTNLMVFIRPKILRDGFADGASRRTRSTTTSAMSSAHAGRPKSEMLPLLPFSKEPRLPPLAPPPVPMPAASRPRTVRQARRLPDRPRSPKALRPSHERRRRARGRSSAARRLRLRQAPRRARAAACTKASPSASTGPAPRRWPWPKCAAISAFRSGSRRSKTNNSIRCCGMAYEAGNDAMQAAEGVEESTDLAHLAQDLPEQADLLESEDDAPIIRLINAVLTQAVKENASDIHVEPFENRLVVRFRVDGVLREVLQSRRAVAPLVVSRIKVMSKLDIAEKRLPQDGRISLRIAGRSVDVRVSTLPSGHGERVVMRILDKQAGRLHLSALGMDPKTEQRIAELFRKPHGIILVTGPTGSGKTTTLYAGLEHLNDNTQNIMTVEDPIEYYIDGIGQTQVNTKVEMTFARGLRAILRQDPDVVMVGEIRDLETAQIAVQASLTGHLVLSTLHTNTAVGALTRLRDMGIEPFLLSSSLIGVVAQRLVRTLNPDNKVPFEAGEYERRLLGLGPDDPSPTLYRPGPGAGGFRGRTGIYELVIVDDQMRTMIHDEAAEHDLERYARTMTPSIRDDGLDRVLRGETTVEEVLRVTRED